MTQVFPVIQGFVVFCVMIVLILMLLRLLANYTDPNPFGTIGRLFYRIKKITDRFVYPVSRAMASMRLDTRLAPLIVIFGFIVAGYFLIQFFSDLFVMIDGVAMNIVAGSIAKIAGHILYGLLSIYSLMIVLRIIMSWIGNPSGKFVRFLIRLTEPVLGPFRRMIPMIGPFDISPIVVIFIFRFLQMAVAAVLLA
ncbi:MAG: YggT family protein [Pyrinomonadaceae bacterium]